jgi:hypothetical protein
MSGMHDDFEYAADGLWIDGTWYPPIHGGQDSEGGGTDIDYSVPQEWLDPNWWNSYVTSPGGGGGESAASSTGNPLLDTLLQLTSGELTGLEGTQAVQELLRLAGLETMPARIAGIQEAIAQQQRLAAGSPREIATQYGDQIDQIQQQLRSTNQQLARRGGYNVGGQREQQQSKALAQAAQQLQSLYTQGVLSGRGGLLNVATTVRPLVASQIPPARESIQTGEFPFGVLGETAGSLASILQRTFPAVPSQPMLFPNYTTPAGLPLSGTNPYTGSLLIGPGGTLGGGV